MATWFKLENYAIKSASGGSIAKSVGILVDDLDTVTEKLTTLAEVTAKIPSEATNKSDIEDVARLALLNGASGVYMGSTVGAFAKYGNDIRCIASTMSTTDMPIATIMTAIDGDEEDGICRIFVTKYASTITSSTCTTGRIVVADYEIFDSDVNSEYEVVGALMGLICSEALDPSLPISNVPVKGFEQDNIAYQSQSALKTKFTAGKTTFHVIDGEVCTFAIPTTTTSVETWKDLTTRLIADDVADTIISHLKTTYRRSKNSDTVLASIRGDIDTILTNFANADIIENYDKDQIIVVRDPADQYGCIITYMLDVVTPLYNVTIKQNVTLSM